MSAVYVILCERGFRYVGKVMPCTDLAGAIQKRFDEHRAGGARGSAWTSLHRPVCLERRLLADHASERDETLAQMRLWGTSRVRGAGWCRPRLGADDLREIRRGWIELFDLCLLCGSPDHLAGRCDSSVHHLTLEPMAPHACTAAAGGLPPIDHLDAQSRTRLERLKSTAHPARVREAVEASRRPHIRNPSAFMVRWCAAEEASLLSAAPAAAPLPGPGGGAARAGGGRAARAGEGGGAARAGGR